MAIVWHKIKNLDLKRALLTVGVAGFVALALSYALASADGKFNIFPISYTGQLNNDLPMIDAKNVTQGGSFSASQTDHDNGVSANPGDTIEVSIYYHNGAANEDANIARNVIIKAMASPSIGTAALKHTLSASISADNATGASSASRGGNIAVNIQGSAQKLSLVPGSVTLFRDQGDPQLKKTQSLPDSIFSGVNIGDVRGCFEFHGFVNFQLRIDDVQPTGNLEMKKFVDSPSDTSGFQDHEAIAKAGETVEYKMTVRAHSHTVQNVKIKDDLDSRLSFTGTITTSKGGTLSSGQFFGSGASLGDMAAGEVIEVFFKAKLPGNLSAGTHTFENKATVFAGSQEIVDSAFVKVNIEAKQLACVYTYEPPHVSASDDRGLRKIGDQSRVNLRITGLEPNQAFMARNVHSSGSPVVTAGPLFANSQGVFETFDTTIIKGSEYTKLGDYTSQVLIDNKVVLNCKGFRLRDDVRQDLDLEKTVKNLNTGAGFADQVDARPGEQVQFRIVINPLNSNETIYSVNLVDHLPSRLTFVPGSLNVDGHSSSDGLSSINVGNVDPNQPITVTFKANVASGANFSVGCEILTNNVSLSATRTAIPISGVPGIFIFLDDDAHVNVCKDAPTKQPGSPADRPELN